MPLTAVIHAKMKPGRQLFAIIFLLTCIGATSTYSNSYYDTPFSHATPWLPAIQTTGEQEFEIAGGFKRTVSRIAKEAAERAAKEELAQRLAKEAAEKELNKPRPIPYDHNVLRDSLDLGAPHNITPTPGVVPHRQADVTARTIIEIADYVRHGTILNGILDEIGYSRSHVVGWERLPVVRQIHIAHAEAEAAVTGGGVDLLRSITHHLPYQSVEYHPVLKWLLDIPPKQSIKFAELDLSSHVSMPLSKKTKDIINAIAEYCDSAILGGMPGILRNWLGLSEDVAYNIMRSSTSDSVALWRGLSRLDPSDASARIKEIIENLRIYESAWSNVVFNEFRALPPLDYHNPRELEKFRDSIGAQIERENRVDVQATHPSELRAPSP